MVRNLTKEALWHVKDSSEQTVARSFTIRAQQGNGDIFFRVKTNKKKVGDHFKASDVVILVDVVTPRGLHLVQPICLTAVRLQDTLFFLFFFLFFF